MEAKHYVERPSSADHARARRERHAESRLLDKGADQLTPRPWKPDPATSPSAVDLTQYALWRSSELTPDELLGSLSLLPAARAELESVEVGLLFVARSEGLTWAQIAEAMGFRSPQACQQYVNRLSARQDGRA
ncbi:DNA-binding protein [Rhodococcus sp. 1163]|uniref:DNA-binding protein n=1 Tax=Rhodococcus sp. 1163 TaxID=1905289 RepID=UPI000A0160AE|nr:DNA-binding protein [Rhodococcus sp. 1163]ORI19865.1 DNA-binding protein [Rhodococcus sp. 1163]